MILRTVEQVRRVFLICWVYLVVGRCRYAGYAGARNAGDFSRALFVGSGICVGAPADGAHPARRRARPRHRVEREKLEFYRTMVRAAGERKSRQTLDTRQKR